LLVVLLLLAGSVAAAASAGDNGALQLAAKACIQYALASDVSLSATCSESATSDWPGRLLVVGVHMCLAQPVASTAFIASTATEAICAVPTAPCLFKSILSLLLAG
jgi:hypothetical protein